VVEGVKARRKREAARESEEAMDTSSFNSRLKVSNKGSLDYMAANILGQTEKRDMMVDEFGRSTLVRHDGTIWQAPKNFGLEAARDVRSRACPPGTPALHRPALPPPDRRCGMRCEKPRIVHGLPSPLDPFRCIAPPCPRRRRPTRAEVLGTKCVNGHAM
jgi:hypothetical protein